LSSPQKPADSLAQLGQPLDVALIKEQPPATSASDVLAEQSERDKLEIARLELENKKIGSELDDLKQDRDERLKYASRAYCLLVAWLAVVVTTVILNGITSLGFALSDAVILMLLGTSTTGVISIFLIVANYLFPKTPRTKPH